MKYAIKEKIINRVIFFMVFLLREPGEFNNGVNCYPRRVMTAVHKEKGSVFSLL